MSKSAIDTFKTIQRLESIGFERNKAESIVGNLVSLTLQSSENLQKSCVLKSDFEKTVYTSKVDLAALRSEVSMMEKNDFSLLKSDIKRLQNQAYKLPSRLYDESKRVQSNVRLELSLDKARIRDEQASQELKIQELLSKIDAEVSNSKTQMETVQWELVRTTRDKMSSPSASSWKYEQWDRSLFLTQMAVESVLTCPLQVSETLAVVQYHKRGEFQVKARLIQDENTTYQSVEGGQEALPLHLDRLSGDFTATATRLLEEKQEGWTSLFKGQTVSFCHSALFKTFQPYLEESLNDFFDVYDDVQPVTLIASNLIVGLALSPLELVRTRLVIQSGSPHRKKYSGALHALYLIYNEEKPSPASGILSTFYHPRVLFPSILIYSISPFIRYLSTAFIEKELGYDSTFTPIMYNLCQLGMIAIEAFITAPLELARYRLFAQRIDGKVSTNDNCIETSHQSYSTPFDCLQSVVIQEGGRRKRRPKNAKISVDDWQSIYGGGSSNPSESDGILFKLAGYGQGLASCFRGFLPRYCSLVVRYISQEINKEEF